MPAANERMQQLADPGVERAVVLREALGRDFLLTEVHGGAIRELIS